MAFSNIVKLAILTLAVFASFQYSNAEDVHVVGGDFGWAIPPGGPLFYEDWALSQDFEVGDILLFNFTNGEQDVARVTKEQYWKCNTTNPISLNKTSPANFTLDTYGYYYFISTLDNHCVKGQKLTIYVPGPRVPVNYTVGDRLGWIVPPGGEDIYVAWAYNKLFLIGDSLVFFYVNETQDVAVVTKEAYEKCETNNTLAVYSTSPTRIILNTTGEHFFTSTYKDHCALGQKLAINVTANSSTGGTALPPGGALSPTDLGPSASAQAPSSSAPPMVLCGYMISILSICLAFFI